MTQSLSQAFKRDVTGAIKSKDCYIRFENGFTPVIYQVFSHLNPEFIEQNKDLLAAKLFDKNAKLTIPFTVKSLFKEHEYDEGLNSRLKEMIVAFEELEDQEGTPVEDLKFVPV